MVKYDKHKQYYQMVFLPSYLDAIFLIMIPTFMNFWVKDQPFVNLDDDIAYFRSKQEVWLGYHECTYKNIAIRHVAIFHYVYLELVEAVKLLPM